MVNSVSSPFFLSSAEDLLRRLEGIHTPEAQRLVQEAHELIAMFREWPANRPSDEARVAGIGRLFELNRKSMDLVARQGVPSSGRTPKSSPPESGDGG